MNIEMYTYYEDGTFNVLFDNGTTRDTIVAGYQHHNEWDSCTYDMSEYVGQTGRIVFEGWGPTQTNYAAYWYIRNISFEEVYVAPEAPAVPTIQYGGGYFTADNLPVALTTTETRPNYILVTIDGSEPSFEGVMMGTTLPVPSGQQIPMTAESTTIKARGFLLTEEGQPYQTPAGEYIYSEVVEATFTKVSAPVAPEFTPAEGEYTGKVEVSIASATENVMIKYEFGGTEPTGRSTTYTASFNLTETTVVSAMAFLVTAEGAPIMDVEGMPIASEAVFAEYTIVPSGPGVDVENVEVAAIVYAKDGMVYVDTEMGNMIEVFTVQGQRIYAAEAITQLTAIDAFAADIVLVRVNGEIIKVSVK